MQKLKRPPVNALDSIKPKKEHTGKFEYQDVPVDLDDYHKVLEFVASGNYNAARSYLDTLETSVQTYIKTHVALKTQVML